MIYSNTAILSGMYTKNKILEIFIAILGEGEIKFFLEPRPLTLVRETVDTEQS